MFPADLKQLRKWFCMANKIFLIIVAILCLCNLRGEAFDDIPGSQDHPMLSRYPNSVILKYKQTAFDRLTVASGPERKGRSNIPVANPNSRREGDQDNLQGPGWKVSSGD